MTKTKIVTISVILLLNALFAFLSMYFYFSSISHNQVRELVKQEIVKELKLREEENVKKIEKALIPILIDMGVNYDKEAKTTTDLIVSVLNVLKNVNEKNDEK